MLRATDFLMTVPAKDPASMKLARGLASKVITDFELLFSFVPTYEPYIL